MLRDGAAALGVTLSEVQQASLLDYLALLSKWNGVYNLTAIREPRQMLIQHVLDSLAIVPHLAKTPIRHVLDVGSGGGLPGVVLAIARPDWQVTLNDIVHKKSAFQVQAKVALRLGNLSVVTGRVQTLRPGVEVAGLFDAIVSRAFAELSDFVSLAGPLLAPDGVLWAMKGVLPAQEIAALPDGWRVEEVVRLSVPQLDAERHLIAVRRAA
ncbi:16S rRNA (guanine(527)-N(7))-methyltransferase RsmG [Pandoraea sp.]|uniref:16S rRNA (guanine(527)-N(7))-methyltransferase RsmG n=1 Tax=Pandoraea sp. TaxID=1883445 RepID=UPI0025F67324|nr:16S rRNA (guanine(527)-N(7))-methyltransferase RsmG [Pandoraea sp.]